MRLRGAFSGKRGRRLGLASAILPLTGYVIQDLRKPDSIIRALTQRAGAYLTERIATRRKQISSSGRVEILETTADDTRSDEKALMKEDDDARRR
jgi:hypothetical protein